MAGINRQTKERESSRDTMGLFSEVLKVFASQDGDVISSRTAATNFDSERDLQFQIANCRRRFSGSSGPRSKRFSRRRIAQANEYRDRRTLIRNCAEIVLERKRRTAGVILDRYDDYLVLQTLTGVGDGRAEKIVIVTAITDLFCAGQAGSACQHETAGDLDCNWRDWRGGRAKSQSAIPNPFRFSDHRPSFLSTMHLWRASPANLMLAMRQRRPTKKVVTPSRSNLFPRVIATSASGER